MKPNPVRVLFKIIQDHPTFSEQQVLATLLGQIEDVETGLSLRNAIVEAWFGSNYVRLCSGTASRARQRLDPAAVSKAKAVATERLEAIVKTKALALLDTLRLPDGRLFADVPRYEYGALKREFRAWVGLIEAVENHVRVNDDSTTARQTIKPQVFEEMAEKAGITVPAVA